MPLAKDSQSTNALGGTELMKFGLRDRLEDGELDEFQLFVSRVEEVLDPTKIRVLWLHDLPGDPSSEHLKNEGWKKFHRLVFTSNWQMQNYIAFYRIPWNRCICLQNAIDPVPFDGSKWNNTDKIKLIYTPTPHRGLNILVPVFSRLRERYPNLELDVYSSFKLYGWEQRDTEFEELYKQCRETEGINYHGTVPNEKVREALQSAHIFAYPSTWPETACLSLMEAMSAGCICVHSNYAALPETAANWTHMYHFSQDLNEHASTFFSVLVAAIEDIKNEDVISRLNSQKAYADIFYSWNNRIEQWKALLGMLKKGVTDRGFPKDEFVYRTG